MRPAGYGNQPLETVPSARISALRLVRSARKLQLSAPRTEKRHEHNDVGRFDCRDVRYVRRGRRLLLEQRPQIRNRKTLGERCEADSEASTRQARARTAYEARSASSGAITPTVRPSRRGNTRREGATYLFWVPILRLVQQIPDSRRPTRPSLVTARAAEALRPYCARKTYFLT
jgi:hypothetical protein